MIIQKENGLTKAGELYLQYENEQARGMGNKYIPQFGKFISNIGESFKKLISVQEEKWVEGGTYSKIMGILKSYHNILDTPSNPYKSNAILELQGDILSES